MKPLRLATIICATFALAAPALAADHTINMLNYGTDGGMVFEPAFVKVEVGDTVTFQPKNTSHYVQSYVTPEGVTPWKSKLDEPFTVTIDKEGVYMYYCPPHLMMSMIGVIQAGNATNMEAVTAKAAKLKPKLVMKGERLDAYLGKIAK